MSSMMLPMMMTGTVLSGIGQYQAGQAAQAQGVAQQAAANYTAEQLQTQAGQVRATSQAAATDQQIKEAYTLSTLRANAAGTGGTATRGTPLTLAGQIAARGEYDTLATLYTGNEKAIGLENQASLDVFTGQQEAIAGQEKAKAADIAAIGSVLSSSAGLYAKYGSPVASGSGGSPFGNTSSDASNPATYG